MVDEKAEVPADYRIAWAGRFKYFERAKAKLKMLVPLTLFSVFFILFLSHGSLVEALIILLAIPLS